MGLAGLMRLEAEAKNSSEKERMREVRGAEMRSVILSALVLGSWCVWEYRPGRDIWQEVEPLLEMERRELYQCMWCRGCDLFGLAGWNRLGWTGRPESFRGRVLGFPFLSGLVCVEKIAGESEYLRYWLRLNIAGMKSLARQSHAIAPLLASLIIRKYCRY